MILIAILCLCFLIELKTELICLDEIVVTRVSSAGIMPVYRSDAWFSNPIIGERPLESVIVDSLWLSYGAEHGIKMVSDGASDEYAERYFDMIQEQKGVSKKKIETMVREYGFSLDDIKKFLNNQYLIQQTIETFFAASGKLNISHEEIVDYYELLPPCESEVYTLQCGAFKSVYHKEWDEKDILNHQKDIVWDKPYDIEKDKLSHNFVDIDERQCDSFVYYDYDFQLKEYFVYRYIGKKEARRLSLNDSYEDIMKKIQLMKYEDSYRTMTLKLLADERVIYSDLNVKADVLDFVNNKKMK